MARTYGSQIESASEARQPGESVTAGAASVEIVPANAARALLILQNDHATQVVYLRLGTGDAVLNKGIRLNAAGGTLTIREYTGRVAAIATGAGTPVLVTEV